MEKRRRHEEIFDVWGFDENAVQVLKNMRPAGTEQLIQKYSILLDHDSELLPRNLKHNEEDSVTNRVAGFICKHVLNEHMSCVTCLEVIGREHGYDRTYVLSAGWDRRICIWDLEKGKLHDTFRNSSSTMNLEHMELASDGVIVDMAFNPDRKEFAYSSSDKMVYIRKFSLRGPEMVMINTLQGHDGEVTCVRWNRATSQWVTGSEDATIRIWSGSGMNECEQILATQGQVSSMCIDLINGSIVAGIQEIIRVYDPEHFRLVQTNVGHTDAVRSIIHIPERNQYVSASWDKTIRIWNAWQMPRKKNQANAEKPKEMKRTSISSEVATEIQTKPETDSNETETIIEEGVETSAEEPEASPLVEEE